MQLKNRWLKCHPNYLQEITKNDILRQGCISICDDNQVEQMVFLLPGKYDDELEVRIYKAHSADTYVPNKCDLKLKRYEENDIFASFFFDGLIYARHFIRVLKNNHPEYDIRPKFEA